MENLEHALMAYADGELAPEDVVALEERLAREPELRARVQEYRDNAALLRAACAESFYAEPTARPRLPQTAGAPRPRFALARRPVAWAIAASILAAVLGFGGGAYWGHAGVSAHDALVTEVAEYHEIFSRETRHMVEIGADRADELFAWLSDRVGRPVSAPDLTAAGLQFAGGRLLVMAGKPVAELMYTRQNGLPVALCVTPIDNDGIAAPLRIDERGNQRVATWGDGRHTFIVVGELDRGSLHRIASFAAAQTGG